MAHVLMNTGWASAKTLDGGPYQVTGTVSKLGVPGRYWVALLDRAGLRRVDLQQSDLNGAYRFAGIAYRPKGYLAIAFDQGDSPLNAAIADLITPEPMS